MDLDGIPWETPKKARLEGEKPNGKKENERCHNKEKTENKNWQREKVRREKIKNSYKMKEMLKDKEKKGQNKGKKMLIRKENEKCAVFFQCATIIQKQV